MHAASARRARSRTPALAALAMLVAGGLSLTTLAQDETHQARMPSFTLGTLDGSSVSDTSLAGKVLLIDFWATWCEPCLQEIPQWNSLYGPYRKRGLEVLGITVQSGSDAEIGASVEKLHIRYRVAIGNEDVVKGFGGIVGFPATFLVDRDGRIYGKYLGQYPSKHARIERDIRLLLRLHQPTAQENRQ